jgi:ferritin-like metal-binding protein YciE
MTADSVHEQLLKYLADVHSIERQALAQMRAAPGMTEDREISSAFADHLAETEEHERLVARRLEALDARPALVKDLAGAASGKAFVLFARCQPDTPGKLVAHAYSYEHMEQAAYELLAFAAEQDGDEQTVELAAQIGGQEEAMGARLEALFDRAVEESLAGGRDARSRLLFYLADAHAIERQATLLLRRSRSVAGPESLAHAYDAHLLETEEHERMLAARLRELDSSPSWLKDAALRLGALNWDMFFRLQPDTAAKLAGFSYAFEHLEIASYELLRRVAARATDSVTEALAGRILGEERGAAERVRALLGEAMGVTLAGLGTSR